MEIESPHLVLVSNDGADEPSPPSAGERLRLRLLLRDEHFKPPAFRQVRVEEVLKQCIGEDAHAEGGV